MTDFLCHFKGIFEIKKYWVKKATKTDEFWFYFKRRFIKWLSANGLMVQFNEKRSADLKINNKIICCIKVSIRSEIHLVYTNLQIASKWGYPCTGQSLYNAAHYNMVWDIIQSYHDSQVITFLLLLCKTPFITWFTYNMVHFYGSQT